MILQTPRLMLRATTDDDIPLLQERIFRDSHVMRYAFAGVPMADNSSEAFVRRFFAFGDRVTGMAPLIEIASGEIIGFAGLAPCDSLGAEDDFEIGFVLARQAWGRGIATEIGQAQLAFGFQRLGCRRLLGLVHPQNTPSIHALTKLGLRYMKDVQKDGRADRSVYLIEARDWKSAVRE